MSLRTPTTWAIWISVSLFWAALHGCCAHRFERPSDAPLLVDSDDAAVRLGSQLRERVKAYAQQSSSIVYTTRMEHYGKDGVVKGKVDVLAKRPSRFRFEALTPSDDTLAVLASDGDRFMSHQRGQTVCYVGPACSENVSRLLPLPFQGEQLFDLLVGGVPLLAADNPVGRWNDCEGIYELRLIRGDWEEIIWLRPDVYAPVRVVMLRAGIEQFQIDYNDFEMVEGVLQAQRMRYFSDVRDIDLTMTIRDAERNGIDAEGTLFRAECPAGTERRELPCR